MCVYMHVFVYMHACIYACVYICMCVYVCTYESGITTLYFIYEYVTGNAVRGPGAADNYPAAGSEPLSEGAKEPESPSLSNSASSPLAAQNDGNEIIYLLTTKSYRFIMFSRNWVRDRRRAPNFFWRALSKTEFSHF